MAIQSIYYNGMFQNGVRQHHVKACIELEEIAMGLSHRCSYIRGLPLSSWCRLLPDWGDGWHLAEVGGLPTLHTCSCIAKWLRVALHEAARVS